MNKALLIIISIAVLGILASYVSPLNPPGKASNAVSASSVVNASSNQPAQLNVTSPVTTNNNPVAATPTPTPMQSNALKDGTFNSNRVSNPYGEVQISIGIQKGKITAVNFINLPSYDRHSQMISNYVAPILKNETLTSQSANIDTISGATYTSTSYIESLQSAINQAKI